MEMFKNILISSLLGLLLSMAAALGIFGATLGLCAVMLLGNI